MTTSEKEDAALDALIVLALRPDSGLAYASHLARQIDYADGQHDDDGERTEERGDGPSDVCECGCYEHEHAWTDGREGNCTVCTCESFRWNGEVA